MKNTYALLFMLALVPTSLQLQASHYGDFLHERGNKLDKDSVNHDFNSLADVMNMIAEHKAEGSYDGSTPLHYLAEGDNNDQVNLELVKELLQSHPQYINDQHNLSKESPLHVAADSENFELIKLFLNAGANVNAQDINGRTALHFIACDSEKNDDENTLKIAQFLIENKADISIKDNDGKTAVDLAVKYNAHPALKSLLVTLKNLNM